MMMESPPDTMVEEMEEIMIPPTGGDLFLKKAYFLKPIVPSYFLEPPFRLPDSFSSIPSHFEPRQWPLKVEFRGWRKSQQEWKTWVEEMASIHQSTWKNAGIYEAILNSTYQIKKTDLVYGFAEKWCHETNTFIFPWGEATITLEDVMVLGGYSVLGDSVLTPLESEELQEIKEKLNDVRREMNKSTSKKPTQSLWLKKFMNSGTAFNHEAFLAFWLSRYVFIGAREAIDLCVLSIAIHLARGTRIALAPAVLASIYKDLSLLKSEIVNSSKLNIDDDDLKLTLKSPFQLVQVWAWERFLELSPKPNVINSGQPRLARWDKVNGVAVENLRMVLNSAGDDFKWRPYSLPIHKNEIRNFPKYYPEEEMWVVVDSVLDDELQSFARCLKVSELIGLDGNIQQYLPHRVALQFGFDQDHPCFVARSNHSSDIVWQHYIKGIKNVELYIPPRLSEADVSPKYLEWWKESMSDLNDTSEAAMEVSTLRIPWDHPLVPPGFPPKKAVDGSKERNKIDDATITSVSSPKNSEKAVHVSKGRSEGNHSLVPPTREAGDPTDEDRLTISQLSLPRDHLPVPPGFPPKKAVKGSKLGQVQNLASSIAEESDVHTMKSERLEREVMYVE